MVHQTNQVVCTTPKRSSENTGHIIDRFTAVQFQLYGAIFLQNPVDPGDACPGPSGNITQYQMSFQTESVMVTENVNIARCTAGKCSHTFEPPSNPPSSYDSVSVAAENVVGVGAARPCAVQTISE